MGVSGQRGRRAFVEESHPAATGHYLLAAVIVSDASVAALGAATAARSSAFPRQISTP